MPLPIPVPSKAHPVLSVTVSLSAHVVPSNLTVEEMSTDARRVYVTKRAAFLAADLGRLLQQMNRKVEIASHPEANAFLLHVEGVQVGSVSWRIEA